MVHLLEQEKNLANHVDSIQLYSVDFRPVCFDHGESSVQSLIHAVWFPSEMSRYAHAFWQRAGPGLSSRQAQYYLQSFESAQIVPFDPVVRESSKSTRDAACEIIRARIAGLVERALIYPSRSRKVAPSDVFLYPSGMAAIYQVHRLLLAWRGGESAHVGLLYDPTLKILETQGPGLWSYNLGTEADLDQLASQQELLFREGRPIRMIWCECPSNPLLQTVDFHRLRRLADQYDMVLVVDDSIGSFANVDMLGVADVVITSLSKVFSGKADVMAGRLVATLSFLSFKHYDKAIRYFHADGSPHSVILNPNSPHWAQLHAQMASSYQNDLFADDAIQLEYNSRDFLDRVARINKTTQRLIDTLAPLVSDPSSPVTQLFYPSISPSRQHYKRQMRRATEDFCPGYGGLFTIEFATVATAAGFFDNLHVFKGFSFGADVTIATPYVQMTMQGSKKKLAEYGVKETIIRFSTGLEDLDDLLDRVNTALRAADEVWMQGLKSGL